MEHSYWEERLQGYLDNELAPADTLAMESHIDQCKECEANRIYFGSLKRRLKAHAATVVIPEAVEQRIHAQLSRSRNTMRRIRSLGIGLSLAAAVLVGFLLPSLFEKPYQFERGVSLTGVLTCYDCEIGERLGMALGGFCGEDHQLGLRCENGELWRFSGDSAKDPNLMKSQVRVYGEALQKERIFRVKRLEPAETKQATLLFPKRQ